MKSAEQLKHIPLLDIRPEMSVVGVGTKAALELSVLAFTLLAATLLTNGYPEAAIREASVGLIGMTLDVAALKIEAYNFPNIRK